MKVGRYEGGNLRRSASYAGQEVEWWRIGVLEDRKLKN
jgi:hypothetical protein